MELCVMFYIVEIKTVTQIKPIKFNKVQRCRSTGCVASFFFFSMFRNEVQILLKLTNNIQ